MLGKEEFTKRNAAVGRVHDELQLHVMEKTTIVAETAKCQHLGGSNFDSPVASTRRKKRLSTSTVDSHQPPLDHLNADLAANLPWCAGSSLDRGPRFC